MAEKPTFLVVGDFSGENMDIVEMCAQFGWSAKMVSSLGERDQADSDDIVAGMVDSSFDNGTLNTAIRNLPNVLWIACCRFGSAGEQMDLEYTGAFHLIHRPFQVSEVLQSLGFVDVTLSRRRSRFVPMRFQKEHAAA